MAVSRIPQWHTSQQTSWVNGNVSVLHVEADSETIHNGCSWLWLKEVPIIAVASRISANRVSSMQYSTEEKKSATNLKTNIMQESDTRLWIETKRVYISLRSSCVLGGQPVRSHINSPYHTWSHDPKNNPTKIFEIATRRTLPKNI